MDASPAKIAAIITVAVLCLAFMLIMINVAARQPGPKHGRHEKMDEGAYGGRHRAEGGRPSDQAAASPGPTPPEGAVPTQRPGEEGRSASATENQTNH